MKRIVLIIALLALLLPAGLLAQDQTTTLDKPVVTANQSGTAIKLSWKAVSGASRYEIWAWKNESEGWYALDRNFSGTSYTHFDVTAGTTYWYAVRAANDDNQVSPWSDYASATAPAQTGGGEATATPEPTATPTVAPTATATPNPAATPDTSKSCTLIRYAPEDEPWPDISVPLIQNATMAAYRAKFGENLEDLTILQVELLDDGHIWILYYESLEMRVGGEFYRGCEYWGYTPWVQLEAGWWRGAYEATIKQLRQNMISVSD